MKITEYQLRNAIHNILTEIIGGKKETSFLEDMLGHGYRSSGGGGGGYGYHGYGDDSLYGDYDFYLEDTYGVEMGGDDYGGDGDGGDGDGGE